MTQTAVTVEAERALVSPAGSDSAAADDMQENDKYLLFSLAGDTYGIRISEVQEIIEYAGVGNIPRVPEHIRGVVNLRGNVVPVVDLACRLDKGASEISKRSCIVIFEIQDEGGAMEIGVVVDAVNEVIDIDPGLIEHAPAFGTGLRPDFIHGMARVSERFIALLALETVLDIEELAV